MTVLASTIARELLDARAWSRQIPPYTSRSQGLSVEAAYEVSAEILRLRRARGENPVGRKIGFTNRNIWPEYGVSTPIWSYVYDSTIRFARDNTGTQSLKGAVEPRIEPEIVFCLKSAPHPRMGEAQLAGCIEWVAHGYEIVQSLYPGWKFQGADTVAAFGLHGVLIVGTPRAAGAGTRRKLAEEMRSFRISLYCDGKLRDSGAGANVLDSPLLALKHLVELLAHQPDHPKLEPGEIITTGTLTAAWPASTGETWHTTFAGLDLPGLTVRFA